jgi:quinoprotein glucose dehydrogenase
VAYWRDGDKRRIFTITPGFTLNSLDAETGIPDPKFGKNGRVDLFVGLRNAQGFKDIDIGNSSPPFVMNNVVVVGPAHKIGMRPRSKSNVKGDVRGFDARTGKLLWTFKTIPEKGEPGSETWLSGLEYTGNAGVWAPMSGDPKLGLLYLPVEAATGDRYGGDRPGNNLFSNSLVAVDIKTGKRKWYYQITHHDIWDWDNPSAPVLADLPNGRKIVMQLTKQSWVFAFDRVTGAPIWPIEEKPVPKTDVPGEWTSPTQPFPTRPAPFDLQGFTEADLIDFTPELHAEAKGLLKKFRLSPNLYTPPSLVDAADGTTGTLSLPSATGGANWEGSALDPETGILYVPSRRALAVLSLQKDDKSDIAYSSGSTRVPRVKGLEIVKPPYGSITAIDMNSGEHLWQVPNADTPESIANNPALKGLTVPRTGVPTRSGIVLTKTLLFEGEGEGGGPTLYALDKKTGAIVARIELPNTQSGVPMTYEHNGKQYIALFVSGRGKPTELVALTLPTEK